MVADVKHEDIETKTDPSVARQWDNDVPLEQKFKDFCSIVDGQKIGLLGTYRKGVGPVTRSMGISRRDGPDFLFLANKHAKKFEDLKTSPEVNVSFQSSTTQDWVSITGTATSSNSDPRIKEIWSRGAAAWFGDLGDGVHTGGPEDPRMTLIEVKPKYISYYKNDSNPIGFIKEVVGATITGGVATTGKLRQLEEAEIQQARSM